jgi:hypothetical protein
LPAGSTGTLRNGVPRWQTAELWRSSSRGSAFVDH